MNCNGEIDARRIQRRRPHRVALPADVLYGASTAIYGLARALSGAVPPFHVQRNGTDLVVFCFNRLEAAQTFAERFGGEVIAP